jgi:hypothetical protein
MGKVRETPNTSGVDIDAYRELVAAAVGLDGVELIATRHERETPNRNAPMLRQIATYLLFSRDRLSIGDIAQIMDQTESWVRSSKDYVERRIGNYAAFKFKVDWMMDKYPGLIDIAGYRQRIADAVGLAPSELVKTDIGEQDAENARQIAVWLLLSKDQLPVLDVARIMARSEQWVRSSQDQVERGIRRNRELKAYIERTTAAYAIASS